MKYNISNFLTLARIIVIPIIVICIYMKEPFYGWIAFILFCVASITDYFDGYLARIRNEITNFGTFLDPIADKLLVSAVILILTSKEVIADWDTIPALIILLREIAVSGLREYLAGIKVSVPASRIAKIKTGIQLIALALLILSESGITILPIILIGKISLWIAALLTLYTGYDYLKSGLRHF
ncbi:MAG: CDP-diacylglycerol--glycerol-3-phosphate 3-phosphatidyltransferase [Alphaproteobacteria bacterium MarineAlpha5_Bin5]|nr:MAG: CDP-diacylglycerol--glycerol-3-phosphate 3-phosphatidyltransferase [Alphaproteobacteria bacterium MarineAlpha5_Bin5]PPR52634.1 MAG: CDP-diacylglycerol--glycerol-3-phosphate 3-phosphatidyltransferase [Alphaproteobacteria bacterium MarineAlpha5_Bin4]|tara:strand:+ start:3992 stop:4540 length:549 start_codon:yes stop_codon:yes gene_type:complete